MVSAIDMYEFHAHGSSFKETSLKMDYFRASHFVTVLALWYGNRDAILLWHQKTHAAFEEIDLITSRAYQAECVEVFNASANGLPSMIMIDMLDEVSSILTAMGFTLDQEGFERIDSFAPVLCVVFPNAKKETQSIYYRLLVLLSSAPNTFDVAEVNTWMPTPKQLADMEKDYNFFIYSAADVTGFGARAFLKLGRDDDAYELSRIAVSPEQKTKKKTTLVACHCILGEVAAKRGDLEEAESHFANALKEAKLSRLPMMEVIAARDWKKYLLDPNGRDCSVAEATIDGACARMDKSRKQLESVLSY